MLAATALLLSTVVPNAVASDIPSDFIGKQKPHTTDDKLTPELLWAMGRIGGFQSSPDGKTAVYSVSYYSVKQNKSHTVLYSLNLLDKTPQLLTQSNSSESSAVYIKDGRKIAFLSSESGSSQVWR